MFGKNAIAGVINITTALPENDFGGRFQITAGEYNLSKIGGTVTGPISENTSFRLSATSHKRDGYTKNLELGTEINDRDRYAIRAQLLSELTDNLTIRIIVDKDEAEEVCCTTAALLNGAVTVAVIFNALLFIPVLSKLATSLPSETNPTVPDAFLYNPVSVSAEKVIEGRLLEPAGNVPPAFM